MTVNLILDRSMQDNSQSENVVHEIKQPDQFQYLIFCPGCQEGHGLRVGQPTGPNWKFNGSMTKPKFEPSLLVCGVKYPEVDPETGDFKRGPDGEYLKGSDNRLLGAKDTRCHSLINEGYIQFLSDCTHELAGKKVPLKPF